MGIGMPVAFRPSKIPSLRALLRKPVIPALRSLTITCRGNPSTENDLYKYTNGRFLINEEYQYQQRYKKFDISQLCAVAADIGNSRSPIVSIDKKEGGFCKALLMKKVDGSELIAKIPSKRAGPARYSTESEVATLKYVHHHTKIPVPKVLAWDSDPSNNVGSEYILMEKAPGIQGYKVWPDMKGADNIDLVQDLVNLEKQLASISFPMFGSLFLRKTIGDDYSRYQPLSQDIDPTQSYCIGPSVDRFWDSPLRNQCMQFNKGPWSSLADYGISLANREMSKITLDREKDSRTYRSRRSADEEISDLSLAMEVIKALEPHSKLASMSQPMLWHTDLHLGNIHVSEADPSRIVSIIDWQSISVGPLFLQATWPEFLKPDDEYVYGPIVPKLPDNFEQLDPDEQKLAIAAKDDANFSKFYELSYGRCNSPIYRSLHLPTVLQEIFIRCGEAGDEETIGLYGCLVELYQAWDALRLTPAHDCPVKFTKQEIARSEHEYKEYLNWHNVQLLARTYLDTDVDGWISPDWDFTEVQQRNKSVLERFIKDMSAHAYIPQEEARKMWPFLESVD
ncbi:hypothetical protein FQN57_001341 [Myotisia sp. PD_48]|nr:hypothetical protein FQN57_001341 [Myotisia sp. PD_48]